MPQERVSRYAKSERIHQQQMCATRDAKADPSGTRNKIPDGNTDLKKGRAPEMALDKYIRSFYI